MVGEKAVLEALEAINLEIYDNVMKEIIESYKRAVKKNI